MSPNFNPGASTDTTQGNVILRWPSPQELREFSGLGEMDGQQLSLHKARKLILWLQSRVTVHSAIPVVKAELPQEKKIDCTTCPMQPVIEGCCHVPSVASEGKLVERTLAKDITSVQGSHVYTFARKGERALVLDEISPGTVLIRIEDRGEFVVSADFLEGGESCQHHPV